MSIFVDFQGNAAEAVDPRATGAPPEDELGWERASADPQWLADRNAMLVDAAAADAEIRDVLPGFENDAQ
jgi:hypothetical protein